MWWGYGVIRQRKKNYSNKLQWNEKQPVKMQNFYILLAYLLTAIALLTAVSIYCYLIKYQAKQKHLLPFCDTKNELIKFFIHKYIIKLERNWY